MLLRIVVFLALCASALNVCGQNQFILVFRGTSYETNASGVMVAKPISHRTWLQEYAAAAGITNLKSLAVVYHIKGNELGDTIEIVDVPTGAVLKNLFGLYFGESFGRMYLTSRNNTQAKRIDYVYTDQNSHSLGSALVSQTFLLDRHGATNRTLIRGQMQWTVTPRSTHGVKICTGNFVTAKPYVKP